MAKAASDSNVEPIDSEAVHGFLHHPATPSGAGLVLSHGAGSDCNAPLLVAVAAKFCAAGVSVLRCNLSYRRQRPKGPPFPATAAADRESLRDALNFLGETARGPLYLGGHSYGGRQASMLTASQPKLVEALLLLSYPLHPPNKPLEMRTKHFPELQTRSLFVSGTADPFGSIAELEAALALIPAPKRLLSIAGAGHDLKGGRIDLSAIVKALLE